MTPTTAPSGSGAPISSRNGLVAALVIAAATSLAYSNTFGASFHLDDYGSIVQNARVHDLRRMWPPSGSRWLGDLTFALNYRLGGLEVAGYHAVNVAIHLIASLLVAILAAATLRTPRVRDGRVSPLVREHLPLAAGLLFALHPLATEAVTYVCQRYASLATLLYVLAIVLYAHARLSQEKDGPATRRFATLAILSVASAAAAMMTKEIAVTLPLAAAGYELLFFRSGRRRFLLVAALAATAAIPLVDPSLGPRMAAEASTPRTAYALTQARVVATYLRLLVLPVGQNLDYDFLLSRSVAEPAVWLSMALILAVAASGAFLVLRARRSGRVEGLLVGGGIAWFFVTVSVESSVIPIRDVIFEHRVYLPCVGAAIAFGTALLLAVERLRLRWSPAIGSAAALALVAVPLGLATHRRNMVWKDDLTLWSDVVAKSPGKARPHQFLGEAHAQRGELDAAVSEYLVALRISPGYLDALFNLGNAYLEKRDLSKAAAAFTLAVRADPGHAMAHNNLGATFHRLGDYRRAAEEYAEALRLDPGLTMARKNLALLGARTGGGPGH